jgi:hypothetical protein
MAPLSLASAAPLRHPNGSHVLVLASIKLVNEQYIANALIELRISSTILRCSRMAEISEVFENSDCSEFNCRAAHGKIARSTTISETNAP